MLVQNRIGLMVVGVLMVLVLAGAGCSSREKTGVFEPVAGAPIDTSVPAADDGTDVPTGGAGADAGAITNWATYRSDALGIAIPYPEGWYKRERDQGGALHIDFHPTPLPSFDVPSDAAAAVSVVIGSFDEEATVQAYGPTAQLEQIMLDGQDVRKLSYSAEVETPGAQDEYVVYLWRRDGRQYLVEGAKDDSIVLHIARALIARPTEGGTP